VQSRRITQTPGAADLLALAGGGLLPLAFAPFELAPLALIGPALLLWVWQHGEPRRGLWRGWLFGLGMFGVGTSWVHVSIHEYGHTGLPLSIALTALLVAYLALFPAALGFGFRRLFPNPGHWANLAAFPAAWTLFEGLRGWLFTGFPWLDLGYSQLGWPLSGLAPVLGVAGVSWALALSAALGLALLQHRAARVRAALLAAFALLWGSAAGLGQVAWTQAVGVPLRVALLQGNIPQDLKWAPEQRRETVKLYLRLTFENEQRDLVVWPETALPVYRHQAEEMLADLDADLRKSDTAALIGMPTMDPDGKRYYNSLLALGTGQGLYHKRHLVPFGEYLPLDHLLRGLINFFSLPMSDFSAGVRRQPPLRVKGIPIAPSICYEVAYPEEVRDWLPAAQMLVSVSNDAWFGHSIGPFQHLQIAQMRALEGGRYLLRATNTGLTAIIDERGELRAQAPQFAVAALPGEAQPRVGATPFVRWGATPVWLGALLVLALALARCRRNRGV
jgi:apolipoprotein N-acyltransferase